MNIYIGCDVKVKYADIYYYHEIPKCPLGFSEIKKVDILWKDRSKVLNSVNASSGELYLRVTMASDNDSGTFWGSLINHCHRIMPLIDWTRSHPDNIHHFCSAFGIDAGWQHYLHV
jgi:DNA-directed RNA polymerase-4 subunit 1